jgi:hypothetical protein
LRSTIPSVRRTNGGGLSLERPFRRPQSVSWEELARVEEVYRFGLHDFDANGNPVGGLRLTTADGRSFWVSRALTRYDELVLCQNLAELYAARW